MNKRQRQERALIIGFALAIFAGAPALFYAVRGFCQFVVAVGNL